MRDRRGIIGKWLALAAAAAAAALFGGARSARSQNPAPRRLALLVAVSRYKDPYPSRRSTIWWDLSTDRDTRALRQVLLSPKYGFRNEDVVVIQDLKSWRGAPGSSAADPAVAADGSWTGTREGILKAFREHLGEARPGDIVVFQFAGHGDQVPDQPAGQPGGGDEADGLDEALVPYDYVGTEAGDAIACLRDDDLGVLLRGLVDRMRGQGSVNCVVDACHSGTVTRGIAVTRGRGRPALARAVGRVEREESGHDARPDAGYVLMSACESVELAHEMRDQDTRAPLGGAFTYHLCEALRAARPESTYRELFDRVRLGVRRRFSQNPVVEGRIDQALFGGAARPVPVYPRIQAVEKGEGVLDSGLLLGVTPRSEYRIYPDDGAALEGRSPLARLRVSTSDTYEARGLLLDPAGPERPSVLKAEQLVGRPAALHSLDAGDTAVRVLLDGTEELRPRLTAAPGVPAGQDPVALLSAGPEGGPPDYDFRITRSPRPEDLALLTPRPPRRALFLLRDDDGIAAWVPDDAGAAAALRRILVRQWRFRMLTGGDTGDDPASPLRVALKIVPVNVRLRPDGKADPATVSPRPAAEIRRSRQGRLVLEDGDYFRLRLEYGGRARRLFVTVVALQQDGSIYPVFPDPAVRVPEANRIGADRRTLQPPDLFRVQEPFGLDQYKVIVTTQDIDLASLAEAPDEAGPAGEAARARSAAIARSAGGPLEALARVLEGAAAGARRSVRLTPDERDWSVATVQVETRPRGAL